MHNSVDSVNVVPQHKTCHGVGWKRESLIRAIQVPWKPIVHFVSTFCWLYYAILCWRSTGRINRHFTMVYHLWRPPRSQCFENPLKTNVDLLFGGLFFSTDGQQVFLGSSIPTTPRCNGSFGHSAEPQRPRCFFMAPTRLWCLGQGIRGCTRYSSGKKIWCARIN